MNWRDMVLVAEVELEPGTLSAATYIGLSPTLTGGGMLLYSKAGQGEEWHVGREGGRVGGKRQRRKMSE